MAQAFLDFILGIPQWFWSLLGGAMVGWKLPDLWDKIKPFYVLWKAKREEKKRRNKYK